MWTKGALMEHTADGAQPPATEERSAGDLVKQLSEQVSVLVRNELKLTQLEMTRKGKQAGSGAGLLGSGALVALYGIGCLIACVVLALSGVMSAWAAALIVGAVLLAVAAALALLGKGRLQKATPPVPAQAMDSIKTDVEEIKERAHR
jgi:hypothetical protein